MDKIYFALVNTPGFFASIIRKTIGISYVHIVISLDPNLTNAYSIGRRNPFIPLLSGFEHERLPLIHRAFPTARYKIMSLPCTSAQKENISRQLSECYKKRLKYHYCILGLPFLLLQIPFYQKHHFTCSSFIAKLLSDNGLNLFDKHFSLITPRDFYELPQTTLLYEGSLSTFIHLNELTPYPPTQWETAYES